MTRTLLAGARVLDGTGADPSEADLVVEDGRIVGIGSGAADAGAAIPDASVAKAREVVKIHRESFAKAVAAGVKVAMGTDSGVTPHGDNLRELALMVEGGMTPMQAIEATTRFAAELTGLADELGTLEPGKRADLVVVDGDPLEVATLADRIEAVYQDGERVV